MPVLPAHIFSPAKIGKLMEMISLPWLGQSFRQGKFQNGNKVPGRLG